MDLRVNLMLNAPLSLLKEQTKKNFLFFFSIFAEILSLFMNLDCRCKIKLSSFLLKALKLFLTRIFLRTSFFFYFLVVNFFSSKKNTVLSIFKSVKLFINKFFITKPISYIFFFINIRL
jgi:hypothetical protein